MFQDTVNCIRRVQQERLEQLASWMAICKSPERLLPPGKLNTAPSSLQRYLDIVAKSDELSERILRGPNEFSRVGRSRAQRHEGEDEAPAIGATKEEVVSLLESLATLH